MVSTFTPNINIEEPARGDDVGVWDTPVNSNMTVLDLVAGAIATQSLNNSNVVLAAAQFQSKQITFNSTLTGSVTITFPTSFKKSYEIQNACTGSSAFTITLTTTAAGGQVIACPPGETIDCFNDGTNLKFKNLGRVGSYWDYAGSSLPAWVSGCTVPPYLNCDGTTFSAATFPALAVILGSTTLPDSRGRARAALNQTTNRMLSSNGGVDGNTNFSGGGGDTQTLTLAQLPTNISVSGLVTVNPAGANTNFVPMNGIGNNWGQALTTNTGTFTVPYVTAGNISGVTNFSATNTLTSSAGGGAHTIMQPTYIGGLTLIRAG